MRRIYLSFLGLGRQQADGTYSYDPVVYDLYGRKSQETKFVQHAEIELLDAENFDRVFIVATPASYAANYQQLEKGLKAFGIKDILPITIDEDMSPSAQWHWFECILERIDHGDTLTVDLTHGYRAVPIVFSTAINFLQKAREIDLKAVFYGAFEKLKDLGYAPIVDMKDFYIVNEWAEAVSRLVEDADARKLAQLSEKSPDFQNGGLNDPDLIAAFEDLTDTIRNVDVNRVGAKNKRALELISNREKTASSTGKILLNLATEKFATLASDEFESGKYDLGYFELQIEIIRSLLEHRLFMQAYTAMRELIGSIGMIGVSKASVINKRGRSLRYRYADVFIRMICIEENKWRFSGNDSEAVSNLTPYFNKLKKLGIVGQLCIFTKDLTDYRNGFDHAWTTKSRAYEDIELKGVQFYDSLVKIVTNLKESQILN